MPDIWDDLAPIGEDVTWGGMDWHVQFHLLTVDEELALVAATDAYPESQRLIAERAMRLAWSIVSINGQVLEWDRTTPEGRADREAWMKAKQGGLLWALSTAYELAANRPLLALEAYRADPNSAAGPSLGGAFAAPVGAPAH